MSNVIAIICEAWRSKNIELLGPILASDFVWYEGPFDEPITDITELYKVWHDDLSTQENIQVSHEVITENDSLSVARWQASYEKESKISELDGVFVVRLDSDSKLTEFRMWWVAK